MAEVEVILKTDAVTGGGDWAGDAFARTHPTLNWVWNNSDTVDFIGTDNKAANPENVLFLRYKIKDVWPDNATILRGKFSCLVPAGGVVLTPPQTVGLFKVGSLEPDFIWNHPSSLGFVPGSGAGEYPIAPAPPSLPFPTDPGSEAIIGGRILLDRFMGQVVYDLDNAGTILETGDADYGTPNPLEFQDNPVAAAIAIARVRESDYVGFVFDPAEVPISVPESIQFLTDDSTFLGLPKGTWGIKLVVTYRVPSPALKTKGTAILPAVAIVGSSVAAAVVSLGVEAQLAVVRLDPAVINPVQNQGATIQPAVAATARIEGC